MVAIIVEYIRSLQLFKIPVHLCIQQLLVHLLVSSERFNDLHKYIQYKVISDSIPTALQINKIANKYTAATQIALDMLSRLRQYILICEILLSKNEVRTKILRVANFSQTDFKGTRNYI